MRNYNLDYLHYAVETIGLWPGNNDRQSNIRDDCYHYALLLIEHYGLDTKKALIKYIEHEIVLDRVSIALQIMAVLADLTDGISDYDLLMLNACRSQAMFNTHELQYRFAECAVFSRSHHHTHNFAVQTLCDDALVPFAHDSYLMGLRSYSLRRHNTIKLCRECVDDKLIIPSSVLLAFLNVPECEYLGYNDRWLHQLPVLISYGLCVALDYYQEKNDKLFSVDYAYRTPLISRQVTTVHMNTTWLRTTQFILSELKIDLIQ